MQKPTIFFITLIICVIYVFGANFIADILIEEQTRYENKVNGGADINVGFMDKVTISIKRPRFYGTIYEIDMRIDLKVFNLFNLPIKVQGVSWVYAHLIVLAGLLIFITTQLNKEKKKEQWESDSAGRYSSYSQYPT